MPLPNLSPDLAEQSASRRLQSQLRDMEAHMEQYIPFTVGAEDGRAYLVHASAPSGMVDEEPYPKSTPRYRLPELLEDETMTDLANAGKIAALEGTVSPFGLQGLQDHPGASLLGRANPAGIKPVHDFQVVWLGSRREWRVTRGLVRWFEQHDTQVLERREHCGPTDLAGGPGWLVLDIAIQPTWFDFPPEHLAGGYYRLTVGSIRHTPEPSQSPPRLTITRTGPATYSYQWSLGHYQFPLAYVEPPGGGRVSPLIIPVTTGSIQFQEHRWEGSFWPTIL